MYFGMNLFNISYWKTSDLYRFSIVFPDSKDPAMLFSGGYHPYEPCLGRICQLQLRRPLQKGTQQWVRPRRRNQQLRKVVWYLGLVYSMFIQPNHPQPGRSDGLPKPAEKTEVMFGFCHLSAEVPQSETLNAAEVGKTLIRFVKDLTSGTEEVTWRYMEGCGYGLVLDWCRWVLMVGQVIFFWVGMFSWCAEDVSMRFYEALFKCR